MTEYGPVDSLMIEHEAVLAHLVATGETSFAATLEGTVPKVFILASARWLEVRVQGVLTEYFQEVAGTRVQAAEFVRIGALDMKFHTLFDWKTRKPGHFFGKFGPDLKRVGMKRYANDPDFAREYDAFLELGSLRNQLVHQNYATFTLSKTADEVRQHFVLADKFVDRLPELLREDVRAGEEE